MVTVPSTPRINTITLAAASAGPFEVGFRLFESDAVAVFIDKDSVTTGYTITANFSDNYTDDATILFDEDLPIGTVIDLFGDMSTARGNDYGYTEPTLTDKLNVELARVTAMVSEARSWAKRGLQTFSNQAPYAPSSGRAPIWDEDRGGYIDGPSADEISGAQGNAEAAKISAGQAALYEGVWLDDVAAVEADTSITFEAGEGQVAAGNYVRTRSEQFSYEVAPETEDDPDNATGLGVPLYVRPRDRWSFNVAAFKRGLTDDTTALLRAVSRAQEAGGGEVFLPPGTFVTEDTLLITEAISIRGAGKRQSVLKPASDFLGSPVIELLETNFIGTDNGGSVPDLTKDNAGVMLRDFSIRSQRDLAGLQHGIRCTGRNDRMAWYDIYIEGLRGTHFHFGHYNGVNSEGNDAACYIRECDFYSIESRGGGDGSDTTDPHPAVVIDTWGIGDGTNLCNFFGPRIVYPYFVGLHIGHNFNRANMGLATGTVPIAGNAIRRVDMLLPLFHAINSSASGGHTSPMARMTGWVSSCQWHAAKFNSTIAGQPGLEMNGASTDIWTTDEDGDPVYSSTDVKAPAEIVVSGDVTSGAGDTFVVNNAGRVKSSWAQMSTSGTDLVIGPNVTGPIIAEMPSNVTTSIDSAATAKAAGAMAALAALPGVFSVIRLGTDADSPWLISGTGHPEGSIAAPAGSIYLKKDQSPGENDSDQVFTKKGGTGTTGWLALQSAAVFASTAYPSTLTPGASYVVNDLRRIGAALSDGTAIQAGMWRDTPPTDAGSNGRIGEMSADDNYFYACTDEDTWKRVALSSW
ncbi:hypothetical protein KM176_16450 [Pseudooceanicola sp. CBS1P-1]|uniref:Rhamnogalacturonase A/B/Epimerase-like pectate lyase domain-containing protein n=1 Tax=Pseudooceanicola albus TaxID=2692189 RepID=A0A6L7G628_9RHOB|nr:MULTISPECIES: glycosyl hydrolase family 28-related protein [Pseudooceanicola]MBT9385466.1 hypothetical protein [Pseudooceanicola endophyticus]MXN19122.1 hypothetical protein [Pseudooceanicola albus]